MKGIKSKDIAAYMGVSDSAVSHWFKGDNSLDIDNLYKICQFVGVSLDQVFGIDPICFTVLNPEEDKLVTAYRGAEDMAKKIALDTLKNNQKKDIVSERMA